MVRPSASGDEGGSLARDGVGTAVRMNCAYAKSNAARSRTSNVTMPRAPCLVYQAAKQGLRKAAKIRSLRVDHRADIPVAHSELSALATVSTLAHSPAHFNSDALPRSKYLISGFHQAVRLNPFLIFASRVCVPQ